MLSHFIWIIETGMYVAFFKKWSLCLAVEWSWSYIQVIGWFITYSDLYVIFSNYCRMYIFCYFTRIDIVLCLRTYHDLICSHWLILYLLGSSFGPLLFIYYCWYVYGCFTRSNLLLCLGFEHYCISHALIHSFFTYLSMFVVFFRFNYCSGYVCGCFTIRDIFVCLWTYHYHVSSSLLDS